MGLAKDEDEPHIAMDANKQGHSIAHSIGEEAQHVEEEWRIEVETSLSRASSSSGRRPGCTFPFTPCPIGLVTQHAFTLCTSYIPKFHFVDSS